MIRDRHHRSRREGGERDIAIKEAVTDVAYKDHRAAEIARILAKQKEARARRAQGEVTEGVQFVDMAFQWR